MKKLLTVHNIREANKINIVKTIIRAREIMRAELAKQNSVSIMTVKKIVDDLIEREIVQEEIGESTIGRKPKTFRIADHLGLFICVSLTSTGFFRYVVYNLHQDILEENELEIDKSRGYEENLMQLMEKIKLSAARHGLELLGIAISVPGAYYEEDDIVNYDLIPDFGGLHLKQLFGQAFPIDNIIVVHDVFVSAQAEYDSLLSNQSGLFYFYVGDGVGGAFIENGVWHTGETRVAGEIGQFILESDEGFVTLEQCVSIPSIVEKVQKLKGKMAFNEVLLAYDRGEREMVRLIENTSQLIAQALYNVNWTLNPRRIVVSCHYKRFAEIIVEHSIAFFERLKDLPIRVDVELSPSQLDKYGEMEGSFKLLVENWVDSI